MHVPRPVRDPGVKRTVTFTKEQIAAYAEASGDRNPIHLDDDFARSVGLPGVIAHGMLQMGIAGTVAAEAAGGGARLRRLHCRFAGMVVPGDTVTAPLTVSNNGTLELRYAMTTSISGSAALSNGLELQIKESVTTCTNAGFTASGTSDYDSTLAAGALGSTTQGGQAGDRTLSASGSEVLCFQVRLPSTASSTLKGLSTTATFTFAAEQTTNNP